MKDWERGGQHSEPARPAEEAVAEDRRRAMALQRRVLQRKRAARGEPARGAASGGSGAGQALPEELRGKLERASGFDMSEVRVHRDSAKPREFAANAFAEGSEIHLGPGQDQHLPHEAWHVAQQKQGRVQPTTPLGGGHHASDDESLEHEADQFGAQADRRPPAAGPLKRAAAAPVMQGLWATVYGTSTRVLLAKTGDKTTTGAEIYRDNKSRKLYTVRPGGGAGDTVVDPYTGAVTKGAGVADMDNGDESGGDQSDQEASGGDKSEDDEEPSRASAPMKSSPRGKAKKSAAASAKDEEEEDEDEGDAMALGGQKEKSASKGKDEKGEDDDEELEEEAEGADGVMAVGFKVSGHPFDQEGDEDKVLAKVMSAIAKRDKAKVTEDEVRAALLRWIKNGGGPNARNYKQLATQAVLKVQLDKAGAAPKVEPKGIKTGPGNYDPKSLAPAKKVTMLEEMRRSASLSAAQMSGMLGFRDTTKMTRMRHHDQKQEFSVGYGGNFLLGGVSIHDYEAMFTKIKESSGLANKDLAKRLIVALTAGGKSGDAMKGLSEGAVPYFTKLVALIQGPEFRRAALNPAAAVSAFNRVASTNEDIFKAFSDVLFAKTDGGSKDSQFHRLGKPKEAGGAGTAGFDARAAREFDMMAQLGTANGFKMTDPKQAAEFAKTMTASTGSALKREFSFGLELDDKSGESASSSSKPDQKTDAASGKDGEENEDMEDALDDEER